MSLELTVFDVKRGLCVFLRTPANYGILIDCGCSDLCSPINAINNLALTNWCGCKLSYFILTHPHSDHLGDIELLHSKLRPSIIHRRRDLDWERVKNSNQDNTAFDFYRTNFFPPAGYGLENPATPVWGDGMAIGLYSVPIAEVGAVSESD